MGFTLIPAIDVVNGHAVRLHQGETGTETAYCTPQEAARQWEAQQAEWLHCVDLDAAFNRGSNHELITEVIASTSMKVELTGGIRDDASLDRALSCGAHRVNIGTAAVNDPEWAARAIERYGDRVAIALDVLLDNGQWVTRTNGWVTAGGDLWETLEFFDAAGCERFVVTDVSKDGTLSGPNVQLLREVAAATDAKIVASGGVSTLDDVVELARYEDEGIDSVIIGKALYEKAFTLPEAASAVRQMQQARGQSGTDDEPTTSVPRS